MSTRVVPELYSDICSCVTDTSELTCLYVLQKAGQLLIFFIQCHFTTYRKEGGLYVYVLVVKNYLYKSPVRSLFLDFHGSCITVAANYDLNQAARGRWCICLITS